MGKKKHVSNTDAGSGKKSIFKLRTGIIFGGFALLILCAGIILLIAGIRNLLTPFSYPESTLEAMPGETRFFEHTQLTTKIAIPGTQYSLYVPDGSFAGDDTVFYDTYNQVTYAVAYSEDSAEQWIVGDLNKGVLNFYADGKDSTFASYVNDVGYLNGYELRYYAGVANVKALGKENDVYSVTYELAIEDGNYILLSAATLNKHYLGEGKALLDAMVYTLVLEDDSVVIPSTDEQSGEVMETESPSYVVDEDGHVVGEVDGVWYEYLNMQDYVSELWSEEVLANGKYQYDVSLGLNREYEGNTIYIELYYDSDNIRDTSFAENIYITCIESGAINYGQHIKPFMQYPGYIYFEIENFENEYMDYIMYGVSDCRITNFAPFPYSATEWEEYMGIYPEDRVVNEYGISTEGEVSEGMVETSDGQ